MSGLNPSRPAIAGVKEELRRWLPENDAEDVYILDWPRETKEYWTWTLKAAEQYHGKSVYPKDWVHSE